MSAAPELKPIDPLPEDRLWTAAECARYLNVSESWVRKAGADGRLPRARGVGSSLRFVPHLIRGMSEGAVIPLKLKR